MFSIVDQTLENVDRETVRRSVENVFGPKGFGIVTNVTLEPVGRWQFKSSWPRDVALYRIETD